MVTEKLLRVYAIEKKPYVEIVYFDGDDCIGHKYYRNISGNSWDRVSNFLNKYPGKFNLNEYNGTVAISLVSKYM